jgi:hemin uptake protein HemP
MIPASMDENHRPAPRRTSVMVEPPAESKNDERRDLNLVVTSNQLFAGRQELLIVHEGDVYRLRITRSNKLILTK